MSALEEEKKELDAAIQAENVKTTLLENQKTIGEFYKKYAHATIDTKETRDQLFNYFIDKIFLDTDTITIATYYYDTNKPIELKDLENAQEMREIRTFPKEFDTSPRSGANGTRTRNPLLAKQVRYQLRHSPRVGLAGLEPATSVLSGLRSNQLSYRPIAPCGCCTRLSQIDPFSKRD